MVTLVLAYGMKGNPGRVLIVDDTSLVRELLRDFLASVGHELATAASGANALEVVPVFQPDVILTDMAMPTGGTVFGYVNRVVVEGMQRSHVERVVEPEKRP